MFIAGEGLDRGARGVLGVALHEAAHAAAAVRRIQDTSRQGRYHNVRYARAGSSNGLAARCGCGRPVRVSLATYRADPDYLRGTRRPLHRLSSDAAPGKSRRRGSYKNYKKL